MIVHGDNVKVQQPEIWRIVASDSRQGEGHRDHDPEFHEGFHPFSATGTRLYHAQFILFIHSWLFHTPQLVFPYVIVEYALVMCLVFCLRALPPGHDDRSITRSPSQGQSEPNWFNPRDRRSCWE
jgi:hypothetical protein